MTNTLPTRGQLERTLSQRIQSLYRVQTGHRLNEVNCQILDSKINILLEKSLTQPEQLLNNSGEVELAEKVRSSLNEAIQTPIRELIEEVLGVPVIDLLSDTTLATERTGMIVVLESAPQMRDRASNDRSTNNEP